METYMEGNQIDSDRYTNVRGRYLYIGTIPVI